jgi:Raf kinase inhibitor-like YbhB/YbcL family protein
MRHLVLAAVVAIGLTACSAPAQDTSSDPAATAPPSASASATASATTTASGFTVTSPDFTDGGELADWATATAFGGQCTGDNLNPALAWQDAPEGTEAFAVVLLDRSANNYIHWVHFDIPGDATGIARGESSTLAGQDGATEQATPGYFGPCPPGPNHRYEFTVYALDAPLGLESGARFADVKKAITAHELAQASIVGLRGPSS